MEQQQLLLQSVTRTDVEKAVHDLPIDKAPGVDRAEVTTAVLQFFSIGKLLKRVNTTTVTLVPKVSGPNYVKEYRPTACCSTVYKIISKIITAKLKETQKGVSARCIIKVDIRKAYDSVEWPFLKMLLLEFGFPCVLVELIMECVTTISYSLLINGGLTPAFKAKKGLRQEDPMADATSIHLLFQAFQHFSNVFGLHANMGKSSLYIAAVTNLFKAQILEELHLTAGELPFKYLGAPLSNRILTVNQCLPLVERMIARVKVGLLNSYPIVADFICRTFLWTRSNNCSKKALVAWDMICRPKSAGGLNVLDLLTWNKATISKLLWALAMKKDKLWLLWIHSFYIKRQNLTTMRVPKQPCGIVRKIFKARKWIQGQADIVQALQPMISQGKYSIKKAYGVMLPQ
ncbi:uncharacterized protein LOC132039468 [Lycium ferocissimum]|uniref:uncharacterized protein LOC132039468 n=1 Tax=Lycium ferocissimum TaxID=112874 RepID=UPI00281682D6|nr:uncharacterized protein LOC132039468 [Lycium ferocissimum]